MLDFSRLTAIGREKPLLHCVSNIVSANDCANVGLAVGDDGGVHGLAILDHAVDAAAPLGQAVLLVFFTSKPRSTRPSMRISEVRTVP